jgi:hypothetical protein
MMLLPEACNTVSACGHNLPSVWKLQVYTSPERKPSESAVLLWYLFFHQPIF